MAGETLVLVSDRGLLVSVLYKVMVRMLDLNMYIHAKSHTLEPEYTILCYLSKPDTAITVSSSQTILAPLLPSGPFMRLTGDKQERGS